MIQVERPNGLVITERRLEGITLAQYLKDLYPSRKRPFPLSLITKTNSPTTPTPNLYFESFERAILSSNGDHVIAVGIDGDRKTLIVDLRIPLNGPYLSLVVDKTNEGVTKAAVISQDASRQYTLHFVDELGMIKTAFEEMDAIGCLWSNQRTNRYLYAAACDEFTTFKVFDIEGQHSLEFTVDKKVDLDKVLITYNNEDWSEIIWTESLDPDHKYSSPYNVYRNSQLLAEKIKTISFNYDKSSFVAIREENIDRHRNKTQIIRDGEIIFETPYKLGKYNLAGKSLIGAFVFSDGKNSRIFFTSPNGKGETEPFDQDSISNLWITNDGMIIASYEHNGVPWALEIPLGQNAPEIKESAEAKNEGDYDSHDFP